jgi:hypothetical protein
METFLADRDADNLRGSVDLAEPALWEAIASASVATGAGSAARLCRDPAILLAGD